MRDFDIGPWLGLDDTSSGRTDTRLTDLDDDDERAQLVRAQHRDLSAAIDRGVDEVMHNGQPMNPRLHLLMHEVVVNQLVAGDPPVVRRTAERLVREGRDRHEIVHMIAGGMGNQLWSAMHDRQPFDLDTYGAYLDGLPASWWAQAELDDPDDALDAPDPPWLPGEADQTDLLEGPSGRGPAAALMRAMIADGVDPNDQDAVDAWIGDFNDRPYEERERLLPGIALPPMALPDDATLVAAALDSPAVVQLVRFLEWVGDGRPLTDKGNLKRADGQELIGLLGTADRFDEMIGDRTFKTKSTTELPGIDLVFRLALAARLARRHRGAVKRTRNGSALVSAAAGDASDPAAADRPSDAPQVLETWRDVVLKMIDMGLIKAGREDRYGLRWWAVVLEEDAVGLLCALAIGGEPLSVDGAAETAHDNVVEAFDHAMKDTHRAHLPETVAGGMGRLVDRLMWLGVVTREGVKVETDQWGYEHRRGGEIALTPLGAWFVRPVLIAQGFDVPVIGGYADASADDLLDAVAGWPPDALDAEVSAWAEGRPDAVDELATAARRANGPDDVVAALAALGVLGDRAEPAVRELASDALLRPFATGWLATRGLAPLDDVNSVDTPAGVVDALAVLVVNEGHDALCDAVVRGDVAAAQLEQLWRVDSPWTAVVLDALGAVPDKKVAKAARRALFKHRNRN